MRREPSSDDESGSVKINTNHSFHAVLVSSLGRPLLSPTNRTHINFLSQ